MLKYRSNRVVQPLRLIPEISKPGSAVQSPCKRLNKTLVTFFPLRLGSSMPAVGQRRIGGQPKPDKQSQSFGCDLGLLVEPSKVPVDAIKATAECRFQLFRTIGRHERPQCGFNNVWLPNSLSQRKFGKLVDHIRR